MLNSKFDINSPEWIDRVFENRNKSYGAYDLRKHYAGNLLKALAITICSIIAIVACLSWLMGGDPSSVNVKSGVVDVNNKPIAVAADGKIKKTSQKTAVAGNNDIDNNDNEPVHGRDVDIKPTIAGGAESWGAFLEKNLHYPEDALDQRLRGTVLTSFIVERDGHISHITIEQPAGHGFDEEAIRVLKLSPKWIPGQKDGHTVRVKYTMPINFRIERKKA